MKKIFSFLLVAFIFHLVCVKPSYALLEGFVSGCLSDAGWTPSHTATLSIDKPKEGESAPSISTVTWVFVCITSGTERYCTTGGDGSMDMELFGSNSHYQTLVTMAATGGGYVGGVETGTNPSKTTDDVSNPQFIETIVWGDAYVPGVSHQWSWVQSAAPTDGTGVQGEAGGQQQASLIFEKLSTATEKCVPIGWDPRGVVFDVNTFYPVKDIIVELSKKDIGVDTFSIVPNRLGLVNPNTTNANNGQYSFFVDSGWYKLQIKNPGISIAPLTATQMETATKLFTVKAGEENIYSQDEAIFEEMGDVAIANIPVSVSDQTMLVKDLTVIDNVPPTLDGNNIKLFGRVSHPRSKMIITMDMLNAAGELKQFVKTDITDGLGEYNTSLSQEVVSEEPLVFQNATLTFELNSIYSSGVVAGGNIWSFLLKKIEAFAATPTITSIKIKPIPTFIEGIAYDQKGVPIPKAIIGVYPFFSQKPMYVTIADEKGRYKIGSQHLPRFEYKLRYKKPTGEVIIVDTSTFIKQNAQLILTENVKPFEAKNTSASEDALSAQNVNKTVTASDVETLTKGTSSTRRGVGVNTNGSGGLSTSNRGTSTPPASSSSTSGTQGIVMIVVVIMVLILLGAGAFIMMKSRQQQTPVY